MVDHFRIFGAELSPYSVKVRSYFRFKQIPHEWIIRSAANNPLMGYLLKAKVGTHFH